MLENVHDVAEHRVVALAEVMIASRFVLYYYSVEILFNVGVPGQRA